MITTAGRVKRKNQSSSSGNKQQQQRQTPAEQLEDALQARDFSKATTMLEFFKSAGESLGELPINPWLAYSAFHMNDVTKAIEVYKDILAQDSCDPMNYLYLGCCHFLNGSYKEAQEAALRGPDCPLQTRLLFQISQRTQDEEQLMRYHQKLQNTVEDQLCLASAQYARTHYQEAIEVFKRILLQTRDYLALNVYVAMCYFKMDYYEVSLEVLNIYLQTYANSAVAINLKACNHYRLYNGNAAEAELKVLIDLHRTTYNVEQDIVKHNLVVFRNGEDALQVLPPMLNVGIPEARLNLIIYHLRNDQINEAYELIKDVEPTMPPEYIIKAVVYAYVGQQLDSADHLKISREYFNFIGSAPSECDTIPGRQCMASYYFLMRDFVNVLVYLKSVKPYFPNDDTFLYSYGIACAGTGDYAEAEDALTAVRSEKIRAEFSYTSWLVRTHIMNRHAKKAWDIYLKMETSESIGILRLMANDCYRTGAFYYAAKAFDVLERLDTDTEYIEGKKGSCVGVFQQVFAGDEEADTLFDVIKMVENSAQIHSEDKRLSEEFASMGRLMKDWAKEKKIRRR